MKSLCQRDTCTPIFIAALFIIAKTWKESKCLLMDERIKKICYICTMEHYSAIKKEILPFTTMWKELEGIMLSEISQTEEEKYCMVSLV